MTRSSIVSSIRLNAGNKKAPSRPAAKTLVLYSFESSLYSRLVREQLSGLEIPYLLTNIGKQQWIDMEPASFRLSPGPYSPSPHTKRSKFFETHGNVQAPYLKGPNTGVSLFESREIIHYLNKQYLLH